jgi:pyruvate formate lyase activating enzyme
MSADEIIEVLIRDKDYYDSSDGGVTFSGGEPFVQFGVLLELLKGSKAYGLHTAVETCGQTSIEKIKEAEPFIDLFLFDLKHVDQDKFHEYTGGDINRILQNLEYISSLNKDKIILRVPVIPEFNYDHNTLCKIFQKACEFGIKTVNLLPYHILGVAKYEQLGREYKLKHLTSIAKDELKEYKTIGEKLGLIVQIGG